MVGTFLERRLMAEYLLSLESCYQSIESLALELQNESDSDLSAGIYRQSVDGVLSSRHFENGDFLRTNSAPAECKQLSTHLCNCQPILVDLKQLLAQESSPSTTQLQSFGSKLAPLVDELWTSLESLLRAVKEN